MHKTIYFNPTNNGKRQETTQIPINRGLVEYAMINPQKV